MKKADGNGFWYVVGIILALALLVFLIYFAIKSGTFSKKILGGIL